nr:DUF4333 domain-containing protein [Mycobacterium sp. JS623]
MTCPDNLNGAQGATIKCELTDAGQTYGVDVSGTRVDAGNVNFDIKADDQSEPCYDAGSTTSRRGLLGEEAPHLDLDASRARTHRSQFALHHQGVLEVG